MFISSHISHLLYYFSDTDLLNTHINNKTQQGMEVSLDHGTARILYMISKVLHIQYGPCPALSDLRDIK